MLPGFGTHNYKSLRIEEFIFTIPILEKKTPSDKIHLLGLLFCFKVQQLTFLTVNFVYKNIKLKPRVPTWVFT